MDKWTTIPSDEIIDKTASALRKNNIEVFIVENGDEAKKKFFELVPENSEIFTNTSTTFDQLGITDEINNSGKFVSLKNKAASMPAETPHEQIKKRQIGTAMQYAVGSIHAITEDGRIMIASGSGSQLPGYAYGASNVVWIAGASKIVKDLDEGFARIYEHILPLEDARVKKVYGPDQSSNPRKILIFNNEPDYAKDRTKLILVKEHFGF